MAKIVENLVRLVTLRGTAADVEALTASLEESCLAYATDTGRLGIYTNAGWVWFTLAVTDHGALTGLLDDDHTQYQKESEKAAANGYAGLNASSVVPQDQLGSGGGGAVKFLREDNSWQPVSTARWEVLTDGSGAAITADGDWIYCEVPI